MSNGLFLTMTINMTLIDFKADEIFKDVNKSFILSSTHITTIL